MSKTYQCRKALLYLEMKVTLSQTNQSLGYQVQPLLGTCMVFSNLTSVNFTLR